MVTLERYRRHLHRKKLKELRKEPDDDYSILNEIAKIKGFKGGKRVEPYEQYVEDLAKEMGFRGKKKGQKIDKKILDVDISPLEEWREYYRKKGIKVRYWDLVPEEDYIQAMEVLKEKWDVTHQKFLRFCIELEKDIRSFFETTKKTTAALSMEDAFKVMDEYHRKYPESMNIYSRDEFIIGLQFCLPEKGIGIKTKRLKIGEQPYRTHIIFEKIPIETTEIVGTIK